MRMELNRENEFRQSKFILGYLNIRGRQRKMSKRMKLDIKNGAGEQRQIENGGIDKENGAKGLKKIENEG